MILYYRGIEMWTVVLEEVGNNVARMIIREKVRTKGKVLVLNI